MALSIILVGLTITIFSDKMLISHRCKRGLMPNLIKNLGRYLFKIQCVHKNKYFPFFRAVNELQETEFRGQTLQARLTERRSPRRSGGVGLTGGN